MSNKFGGWSYNSGSGNPGVRDKYKCSICGREYKMVWAKNRHERPCREREEQRRKNERS